MPAEPKEIISRLTKYCAYQERARSEVEKKLRDLEVYDRNEIDDWLEFLEDENFLNEARFARQFTHGKFTYKHWGRRKIAYELKRKRVPENLIEDAWRAEIAESEYSKKLQDLIQKKKKQLGGKAGFKEKDKISRYLLSKGYEWSLIMEELNRD